MNPLPQHKQKLVTLYMIYGSKYWGDYTEFSVTLDNRQVDRKNAAKVVRFIRPVNGPMRHPDGLPNR